MPPTDKPDARETPHALAERIARRSNSGKRDRSLAKFRQVDLKRALKAALDAGLHVNGFEIEPGTGKIRVTTGAPSAAPAINPLDDWLARQNAHKA